MEQLLEDYERRLKSVMIFLTSPNLDAERKNMLGIKAMCYRKFITELRESK